MNLRNLKSNNTGKGIYYKTIMKFVLALSGFLILLSSISVYVIAKISMQKMIYENTNAGLNQAEQNFNYIDQIVRNFAIDMLYDEDTYPLLYSEKVDLIENYRGIGKIQNSVLYRSKVLKTVYVYNSRMDTVFSTNGYSSLRESGLEKVISEKIKWGIPIIRTLKNDDKQEQVCTYVYTQDSMNQDKFSFIVIDVNVDWIFKNLSYNNKENREIFLIDDQKQLLWYDVSDDDKQSESELTQSILKQINPDEGTDNGYLKERQDGTEYFLSYVKIPIYNWTLVSRIQTRQIYGPINLIQYLWVGITILLIIIGGGISKFIAAKIYRPVQDTLVKMNVNTNQGVDINEIALLNQIFEEYKQETKNLKSKEWRFRNSLRSKIIQKLLEDSLSITQEEIEQLNDEISGNLMLEEKSQLAIVELSKSCDKSEQALYLYSIKNIFDEILLGYFSDLVSIIINHSVVFIINGLKSEERTEAVELFLKAAMVFEEIFNYQVKITYSRYYETLEETSEVYIETMQLIKYHVLQPEHNFLDIDSIKFNLANRQISYDEKLSEELRNNIKTENWKQLRLTISKIADQIAQFRYENIILALAHLVDETEQVILEINVSKMFPVEIEFGSLKQKIFNLNYFADFVQEYTAILERYIKDVQRKTEKKQDVMLEKVKAYVEENYKNPQLCIQDVADTFKMSSKYMAQTFKAYFGVSLAEYILHKRLEEACRLLEGTQLSISEIIHLIGLENESYFYILFKKHKGVTPKQYRQSKIKV